MTTTTAKEDIALMAHLLRRAGFGASYNDLEHYTAKGYQETVEELLHPEEQPPIDEDFLLRLQPGWEDLILEETNQTYWVYRMMTTERPLEEKIALFWHGVHCTGIAKVNSYKQMTATIRMFRRDGLGSFRTLLTELSKDPGMVFFLDNNLSHKGAINENWARELLELFAMGVGNYTEDDVQEAARAFTGWTLAPTLPSYPFGRSFWEFMYDATDHDEEQKVFLGHRGRLNGEDVIEIICRQPATAHFVSRHLYNFFVADEAPVPQWPDTPPRDPQAIETLSEVYFQSNYDIRSMLRVLFNSDFFKNARFAKVKSPTEAVVGTMRLVQDFDIPKPGLLPVALACRYMGQDLLNPPTVEGWHTGKEWIDSGTLVERINFVADQLGDVDKPGIRDLVQRLGSRGPAMSGEELVDGCLEQLGFVEMENETRQSLVEHAKRGGPIETGTEDFARRTANLLQLIVATKEYQFG